MLVRVAAKELTSLILDEERLRAERTDRRIWKSRVTGLEEHAPHQQQDHIAAPRRQPRRQYTDEEDAEYKLALEASKYQEEEDRKKRESRATDDDDDDLAKAIKLSKEEEERRRRELEESNASALFDDGPSQSSQPQYTGFNQGYQQGSAVDFFANPIDQSQMQADPNSYMGNAFTGYQTQPTGYQAQPTGYQTQPTGFQNGFANGFGGQPTGAFDPYGQQQMPQQAFQPQPTGYNPYAQQQQLLQPQIQQPQMQQPQITESTLQPGSNNPWATGGGGGLQAGGIKPMPTGSNNPFAQQQQQQQQQSFIRPQTFKAPSMPTLGSLPEQKTLGNFQASPPIFNMPTPQSNIQSQPQREISEHEAKLNALLASGDGMDTFGNTGNLRIPAQHTAPGTFVNSAGAGLGKMTADATGNNPFLRTQFTGMPTVSYGGAQIPAATGPAGMNGFGGQPTNNPFAGRQQQQGNQGDLIQF